MERNTTTLVGRGSGITHQFERSRLLLLTAGSQGLKTADLSDIASEASATAPVGLASEARSTRRAPVGLALVLQSFSDRGSEARSTRRASAEAERSAVLPALHLSPFTFHLSHSSFQPRAH